MLSCQILHAVNCQTKNFRSGISVQRSRSDYYYHQQHQLCLMCAYCINGLKCFEHFCPMPKGLVIKMKKPIRSIKRKIVKLSAKCRTNTNMQCAEKHTCFAGIFSCLFFRFHLNSVPTYGFFCLVRFVTKYTSELTISFVSFLFESSK